MRPNRRAVLSCGFAAAGLGAAGLVGLRAGASLHGGDEPARITVDATPIASFLEISPDRTRFGDWAFRSGLVLSSGAAGFGGLSGLWRHADGIGLVALTDNAQWLTAELAYSGGRLSGLSSAALAPILGEDGVPLRRTRAYDTEGLAITGEGIAYVGIERVHEVRRFDWARDGVQARGVALPMPAETRDLPANGSFEAVAVAPPGHPLAGAVLAIAEEARSGEAAPTRGWVLTGPHRFEFEVARSSDFDITDAAFLPSGEMLLLERRYSPARGVACRMRRIAADAIRPGATIDGGIIFEADGTSVIDNMEGMALHRDAATGATVVTLVSDDNFSPLQRTVLLEFALLV